MSLIYNIVKKEILDSTIDLVNDARIKVMLVSTGYTDNPDHTLVDDGSTSDPLSYELSGTNYTGAIAGSGRKSLSTRSVTQDDTNNVAFFDAADLTWTAINAGTVGAAIIIKEASSSASDTGSRLIAHINSGGFPITTNGGDLTITWSTGGIIRLSS